MRIVVTGTRGIPNIMGGVETHCMELFPRIAQKKIEVILTCRKKYVKDVLVEYKGVKLINIETPKEKKNRGCCSHFQVYLKSKIFEG